MAMVALKLVRLIEKHSEELAQGLTEQIRTSERMCDFRKVPPAELELAAVEVYRNLGEWLLQKTEDDIESRFGAIATRRAAEGVGLHQFVWALIISRDHLWRFLQREAFASMESSSYTRCSLSFSIVRCITGSWHTTRHGSRTALGAVCLAQLRRGKQGWLELALLRSVQGTFDE
jgi:hypothetical protein